MLDEDDQIRSRALTLRLLGGDESVRPELEAMRLKLQGEAKASPPTATRTRWVAHAVVGLARAATGTGGATAATIAARTAICSSCEFVVMRLGIFQQCRKCGCLTAAKTRLVSESCPDGRWGRQG